LRRLQDSQHSYSTLRMMTDKTVWNLRSDTNNFAHFISAHRQNVSKRNEVSVKGDSKLSAAWEISRCAVLDSG